MNECCKDNKNLIDYVEDKKLCFVCGNLINKTKEISSYVSEEHYYKTELNNFLSLMQRRKELKRMFAYIFENKEIDTSKLRKELNLDHIEIRNNIKIFKDYKLITTIENKSKRNTKSISLTQSNKLIKIIEENETYKTSLLKSK